MDNQQVRWERTTNFTGRNGYMKCNGLNILTLDHNRSVMLSPLTSRGTVGRCDVEIPLEALLEVIATLQALIALPGEQLVQKAH